MLVFSACKDIYHTVTLDTDGGNIIAPIPIADGGIASVAAPIKPGYRFLGWFDQRGQEFSFNNNPITQSKTLTARWHLISFAMIFNYYTALQEFRTRTIHYTVYCTLDEILELWTPVALTSFVFEGWYRGAFGEGDRHSSLSAGTIEDIEFFGRIIGVIQ